MGEKKWNKQKDRWEIDGVPITYTVSWNDTTVNREHYTREFDDVDQGYDFYQQVLKHDKNATWSHNPW